MLVIVPVFLYALFLDDLLRHALDSQETALSTAWDYTVQDYAKKPNVWNVQHYARLMYCDHTSGQDSFSGDPPVECGADERHHKELGAHACWLNRGAEEVTCSLNGLNPEQEPGGTADSQVVGAYGLPLHQVYLDEFGRGGLIRCHARLGVQNYLMGRGFLNDTFSKVALAREKKDKANTVHGNATGGKLENDAKGVAGDVYLLPRERLAILTDTWALTEAANVRPGEGRDSDLYARVARLYQDGSNEGYSDMAQASQDFLREAVSEGLLHPSQATFQDGRDPREPELAITPHEGGDGPTEEVEQQGSRQGYYSSEWRDWEQDNNQRTYDERGNWYMGCRQAEGC
jgi:hypothetical protein